MFFATIAQMLVPLMTTAAFHAAPVPDGIVLQPNGDITMSHELCMTPFDRVDEDTLEWAMDWTEIYPKAEFHCPIYR